MGQNKWCTILLDLVSKSLGDEAIMKIAEKSCTLRIELITWPTGWPPLGTELIMPFGPSFDMADSGMIAWVA